MSVVKKDLLQHQQSMQLFCPAFRTALALLHTHTPSPQSIHRQRPKHAQKLHRPEILLDESDDGARSFETKTT